MTDVVRTVMYRNHTIYECCSLVRSGQARAMGYGEGFLGAFKWIDNWYEKHTSNAERTRYPKPSDNEREYMAEKCNERYPHGEWE